MQRNFSKIGSKFLYLKNIDFHIEYPFISKAELSQRQNTKEMNQ